MPIAAAAAAGGPPVVGVAAPDQLRRPRRRRRRRLISSLRTRGQHRAAHCCNEDATVRIPWPAIVPHSIASCHCCSGRQIAEDEPSEALSSEAMTISAELLDRVHGTDRRRVGVASLPELAVVEAAGGDCVNFVHSFTTGDVKKLPAGRGCEAFVTSPQGKTLGHVLVLRREASLWLVTMPRSQAAALVGHFERYVISEDVTLRDLGDEAGVLVVAGRRSEELLRGIFHGTLPSETLAIADGHRRRPGGRRRSPRAASGVPSYLLVAKSADLPAVESAHPAGRRDLVQRPGPGYGATRSRRAAVRPGHHR